MKILLKALAFSILVSSSPLTLGFVTTSPQFNAMSTIKTANPNDTNLNDLFNWTTAQKQQVAEAYQTSALKWYNKTYQRIRWGDWSRKLWSFAESPELATLNKAMQIINPKISFGNSAGVVTNNVGWFVTPNPSLGADVAKTIQQGINITVIGIGGVIKGSLTLNVKINPAGDILKKITNRKLQIPVLTDQFSTTSNSSQLLLKLYLQKANPTLAQTDLNDINFSSAVLFQKKYTNVKLTATVGKDQVSCLIQFELISATAAQIIALITHTQINVSATFSSSSTSSPVTCALIKHYLQIDNPIISDNDLQVLSFNDATVIQGSPVIATTTVGQETAHTVIKVTLTHITDQEILDRIANTNIVITNGNPGPIRGGYTVVTTKAIFKALMAVNPLLSSTDLSDVMFTGSLVYNKAEPVLITVLPAGKAKKTIHITLDISPSDVTSKITNKSITAFSGTPVDVTNVTTKVTLNKTLQKANPSLTNADLTTLSYSHGSLNPGAITQITVTSTIVTKTSYVVINVLLQKNFSNSISGYGSDHTWNVNITMSNSAYNGWAAFMNNYKNDIDSDYKHHSKEVPNAGFGGYFAQYVDDNDFHHHEFPNIGPSSHWFVNPNEELEKYMGSFGYWDADKSESAGAIFIWVHLWHQCGPWTWKVFWQGLENKTVIDGIKFSFQFEYKSGWGATEGPYTVKSVSYKLLL